jgi:hypothetical protein
MTPSRLLVPVLLLALAGCVGVSAEPPPASLHELVSRATEQGGRFLAFVGPRRQYAEPFLGVPGTNFWALRSWLDTRTGEVAHQLYVEDSYFGAERNWEAAHDAQGQPLEFIPISKNEISCDNGCSYAEEFAAKLPDALLSTNRNGLSVTFTAKSGTTTTITVPGELIAKQLAAVDAAHAALPSAAAAPPPK